MEKDLLQEIEALKQALRRIADPDTAWGYMKFLAREALTETAKPSPAESHPQFIDLLGRPVTRDQAMKAWLTEQSNSRS